MEEAELTVKNNSLEREAVFFGALPPGLLREKMRASDIFVLVSKHEGLPMTILEAMEAGLPVVASSVGGMPEELNTDCGILIKENEKKELARALEFLIANEEKRRKMGDSARKRAEKMFSLRKFLSETEKIYESVLSG